jgi:glutathione synthase
MSVFTSWPPDVTPEQLERLTLLATTYALSHSLIYLPLPSLDKPHPPAPESVIHAPLSLIPTPIPRHTFSQALTLQRAYNTLYARVALDVAFLDHTMGPGGVSDVDDFTSSLWSAWKKLRDEGVPPVCSRMKVSATLHVDKHATSRSILAYFALTTCYINQRRMIQSYSNKSNSIPSQRLSVVSLNELLGCIGGRSCQWFRVPYGLLFFSYLLESTGYFGISPLLSRSNLPTNDTTKGLAEGLAEAHRVYDSSEYVLLEVFQMLRDLNLYDSAHILFVVEPHERNVFDQRLLEYQLLESWVSTFLSFFFNIT